MQELEALVQERTALQILTKNLEDLAALAALENLGVEDLAALERDCAAAEQSLEAWELRALLGGPYDAKDALLTVRSGAGGVDAQDWAQMLCRMYLRYGEQRGYRTRVLEETRGTEAGLKQVTLEIAGPFAYGALRHEAGIHRLVRLSPFNAKSLRQTSFASVEVMPIVDEAETLVLKTEDLRVDTYRSSGAGGQNVNKTESAVRVTHIPTGLVASSQSERSQLQNKAEAMKMLRAKLVARELEKEEARKRALRGDVKSAEWGNQIRSYVLHPYTLVKDHRTGTETRDAARVLDGALENFIQSALRYFHTETETASSRRHA